MLILTAFAPLIGLLTVGSIPQPPAYHAFADGRTFLGIPNFMDVVSNLFFLMAGGAGVWLCLKNDVGPAQDAWLVFFSGIGLVAFGSAYYHWSPTSESLVWDRLPMTIAFMSLLAALIAEFVHPQLGDKLLIPLVALGLASIFYWHWFDDLRLYIWVQFVPLLMLLFMALLFRSPYPHAWLLLVALGWYALAKGAEVLDGQILATTGELASGHTIKHLLAAAGCATVLWMLAKRLAPAEVRDNHS